jgi:hypothetical protein
VLSAGPMLQKYSTSWSGSINVTRTTSTLTRPCWPMQACRLSIVRAEHGTVHPLADSRGIKP